ncbi:XdhC family protein [Sporomusa acidovorans]|uniref:XdhC- CoxI domain-containing protein n=1 Tax=Sporomusa acidovorans (strain ATCC 49682 / DSM 3132 / Mol) TaxID=1123286 RepID=A0ABZ3J2Q4_SPOA4|nr:XdhC family protein [Sporomusa acidovorans]OZC19977.1 putative xanthine dehydrogenase subunit A [Sporomusa acidovorans DSM 3132]SDD48599.1 XdhC and CoxI family protein [Sporomusa acidovorans]
MNGKLLPIINKLLLDGNKAALVTIIAKRGSTPSKVGSQMLVTPDGRIIGTIGGGCAEAEAKQRALLAMDEGKASSCIVTLLNSVAGNEGMACGGIMNLFIQLI